MAKQEVSVPKIQLPADFVSKLGAGIAESRASTIINAGGKALLRLLKDGGWVFGQGDEEVQDNSRWLINITTLGHGYCCWIDGSLRGETMRSVFEPKPVQPPPIDYVDKEGHDRRMPYKEQRAFDLRCLDGDDAGVEVLYKVSSVGGMAMTDKLFQALQSRIGEDQTYIFPAVVLNEDSYKHKEHGKIYTPIMEIVGWHDANGVEQPTKNQQVANGANNRGTEMQQETAGLPPGRARKASLREPPEEPQTTQQAHATQAPRRRPGR